MSDVIRAVDLFCGAGGFSTGLALACEQLGRTPGEDVELHAINHWDVAIETHERNHPWAEHYRSKIGAVDPAEIAEPGSVDLMIGGPECTHFSRARGGKPIDDQKREPAWTVLNWVHKLRPDHLLIENVGDFRSWGPIQDDGTPSRDGTVFEAWINALEAHGYTVLRNEDEEPGIKLTAADYGDPTTRDRLFVVASRNRRPSIPEPTHSDDPDDELSDWVPAAAVIDWDDPGTSLWTRDLEESGVTPLATNTMERIAEGIRRHCDDRLAPFAGALETIGPDKLRALRETAVPVEHAATVADIVDEPFLVVCPDGPTTLATPSLLPQGGGGRPRQVQDSPTPTVACDGAIALSTPVTRPLVQPKNGRARGNHSNPLYPPDVQPFHTITADPRAKLVTPYLCPMYNSRPGQRPRTRSLDRPLMTVPGSKSPAGIATPHLIVYNGQSTTSGVDAPVPTVRCKARFGLCVPETWPWGLDVRYRMLKVSELKQAQGFPPDYDLAGETKSSLREQIGNAVPVGLATALCKHLLVGQDPSLSTFGGGIQPQDDVEVPPYEEVAASDD